MKKISALGAMAMLAAVLAFCLAPSLVKQEARIAVTLWDLASPSRDVSGDFYFRKGQWLADLQTFYSGVRYLWETGRADAVPQRTTPPWAEAGNALLLTHSGASSNFFDRSLTPQQPGNQATKTADPT